MFTAPHGAYQEWILLLGNGKACLLHRARLPPGVKFDWYLSLDHLNAICEAPRMPARALRLEQARGIYPPASSKHLLVCERSK